MSSELIVIGWSWAHGDTLLIGCAAHSSCSTDGQHKGRCPQSSLTQKGAAAGKTASISTAMPARKPRPNPARATRPRPFSFVNSASHVREDEFWPDRTGSLRLWLVSILNPDECEIAACGK
eukprot:6190969-Pleurochrysis_carterae.AAC.2